MKLDPKTVEVKVDSQEEWDIVLAWFEGQGYNKSTKLSRGIRNCYRILSAKSGFIDNTLYFRGIDKEFISFDEFLTSSQEERVIKAYRLKEAVEDVPKGSLFVRRGNSYWTWDQATDGYRSSHAIADVWVKGSSLFEPVYENPKPIWPEFMLSSYKFKVDDEGLWTWGCERWVKVKPKTIENLRLIASTYSDELEEGDDITVSSLNIGGRKFTSYDMIGGLKIYDEIVMERDRILMRSGGDVVSLCKQTL